MEETAMQITPVPAAGTAGSDSDPAQEQERLAEELRAEWEATI